MLRVLLVGIIGAFLAWGGYWFFGSRAVEREATAWIAATPEASVESLRVRGFPNRFDLTLTQPVYDTPDLAWSAPFAQVFALSYKPNHVLVVFPHDQSLRVLGADWMLNSSDMRASLVARASSEIGLDRANLVIEALRARGVSGDSLRADKVRLASRALDDDPHAHEIGAEVLGLRPPPGFLAQVDPNGALPPVIERVHLDGVVRFGRPLYRAAGSDARIEALDLRGLTIDWGAVSLNAEGALQVDGAGQVAGDVSVTLANWRLLLDGLRAAGLWDPGMDPLILGLLGGLAREDGDETTLTLPLTAQGGTLYLGPFALGRLPVL